MSPKFIYPVFRTALITTCYAVMLVVLFSLFRWLLYFSVDFPWYDFDLYFTFLIPAVLVVVTGRWLMLYLYRELPLATNEFINVRFYLYLYVIVFMAFGQMLYNQWIHKTPVQLEQLNEVIDHPRQQAFVIPADQLILNKDNSSIYIYRKANYSRRSSSFRFIGLVVFELRTTNQTIWYGRSYNKSITKMLFNNDERLDQFKKDFVKFLQTEIKQKQTINSNLFQVSSYAGSKKKYLKAIQLINPNLKLNDVTIIEAYAETGFLNRNALMLVLLVLGILPVLLFLSLWVKATKVFKTTEQKD